MHCFWPFQGSEASMSCQLPPTGPSVGYTSTTAGLSHDMPLPSIPLTSLNNLINSSSLNPSDRFPGQDDRLTCSSGSGCVSGAGCEGVRDVHRVGVAPDTPQRASQANPATPLTPLANLKVLMAAAAASSAMDDREREEGGEMKGEGGALDEGNMAGRKMKSLALLCKRFLSIVESSVGTGNEFSLDMMAQNLGTNRRRIYDIINVLEAVEMIVKQSKNWYTWNGRGNLLNTLAKLKAMARDDPELVQWFKVEDCKENVAPPTTYVAKQQGQSSIVHDEGSQDSLADEVSCEDGQTKGGRWDKSLGILCQKFIMLFLVAPGHELTLDLAGSILMPDDDMTGTGPSAILPSTNPKTKVRRLYDIANVLTTLELIRKKTFLAPNHRKMPGYVWCGPSMADIDTVSVCRKSDFPSAPIICSRKMKGTALVRKASFGNRPFIHQYEVKDSNSAPSTPCKSVPTTKPLGGRPVGHFTGGGGSIRRSLSFGGHSSAKSGGGPPSVGYSRGRLGMGGGGKVEERQATPSVVPRPLKQVEYLNEVREFELEMQKHSHRYPHVVSMFQEFIRQCQTSLEQTAASGGRTILPKPPSLSPQQYYNQQLHPLANFTDSLGFSTPQTTSLLTNRSGSNDSEALSFTSSASSHVQPSSSVQDSLSRSYIASTTKSVPASAALQDTQSLQPESADPIADCSAQPPSSLSSSATIPATLPPPPPSASGCEVTSHGGLPIPCSAASVPPAVPLKKQFKTELEEEAVVSLFTPFDVTTTPTPTAVAAAAPTPTAVAAATTLPTHGEHCQQVESAVVHRDEHDAGSGTVTSVIPPRLESANSEPQNSFSNKPSMSNAQVSNTAAVPLILSADQTTTEPHPPVGHGSPVLQRKSFSTALPAPLPGFTKGTLQSPEKPANGNATSFVRVEDYLSALAAQPSCGSTPSNPRLGGRTGLNLVQPAPSHVTPPLPPTGVQSLETLSLLSKLLSTQQALPNTAGKLLPAPSLPLNPGSLVNQKPIPAAPEIKTNKIETKTSPNPESSWSFKPPAKSAAAATAPVFSQPPSGTPVPAQISIAGIPLSLINPNTFLTVPPTFFPSQACLPSSKQPGFISLVPNLLLPPFSTLCAPSSLPATLSVNNLTLQNVANSSSDCREESPPKRAKLD